MGKAAGSVVELIDNVDLTGINWNPIRSFGGTFDGKDFKISNLSITKEGDNIGLIGDSSGSGKGQILNLTVENVTINATSEKPQMIGAICGGGYSSPSLISNVTVCGTIKIDGGKYNGGIIGHGDYCHVIDCCVDGGDAGESFIKGHFEGEGQSGGIMGMTSSAGDHAQKTQAQVINSVVKNITVIGNERTGGVMGRSFGADIMNCSVENVIVKCPVQSETGVFVGVDLVAGVNFIIDSTAKDVTLCDLTGTPYETVPVGTKAACAIGTNVEGSYEIVVIKDSGKYEFSAGDFETSDADAVNGLKGNLAEGYVAKQTGANTYTIVPVFNVTIDDQIVNGKVTADKASTFEGDTVTLTVAPADGYKLKTIAANGGDVTLTTVTEGTTYTFEMPAAAVTVTAEFVKDAQPLDPEEPKESDNPEEEAAKMNENGSVKPEFIKVPTGAVAADYAALFVAVPGNGVVTIELNEDGTNTLQQSANDLAEAVAGLGDSTADSVTVTVTDAMIAAEAIVPGFYYGLGASTTVDGEKVVGEGQWKQATTAGIDGGLTAAKPSADKGFFQIKVSVKNPAE